MKASTFKDLIVWQKAMDVAETTYQLVKLLPKEEAFGLADQLRRSAISIPSNIAEGQGRKTKKEFANFLSIANGSASELETQLLLGERIGYFTHDNIQDSINLLHEIRVMLKKLQQKLQE